MYNLHIHEAYAYMSFRTDQKCSEFIDFIASDLLEKKVTMQLGKDYFFSLLVDGSTDWVSFFIDLCPRGGKLHHHQRPSVQR